MVLCYGYFKCKGLEVRKDNGVDKELVEYNRCMF